MVEVLKKKLEMDFNQAVKHVEQIVKEQGFAHFLTKNVHELFKQKIGPGSYPKYAIILFCSAEHAKAALDISTNIGLVFPFSMVVSEEADGVWVTHVSRMKLAARAGLAPARKMKPIIDLTDQVIKAVWDQI